MTREKVCPCSLNYTLTVIDILFIINISIDINVFFAYQESTYSGAGTLGNVTNNGRGCAYSFRHCPWLWLHCSIPEQQSVY
jgi:hypothetical protein